MPLYKTTPTYQTWLEIATTAIRNKEHYTFFRDGAARRAALAAVAAQETKCGQEAIIDALAASINNDAHICYFDDPCDLMMVA